MVVLDGLFARGRNRSAGLSTLDFCCLVCCLFHPESRLRKMIEHANRWTGLNDASSNQLIHGLIDCLHERASNTLLTHSLLPFHVLSLHRCHLHDEKIIPSSQFLNHESGIFYAARARC